MAIHSSGEKGSKNASSGISVAVSGAASSDTPPWKYGIVKSITSERALNTHLETLSGANDRSAVPDMRSPMTPFHCCRVWIGGAVENSNGYFISCPGAPVSSSSSSATVSGSTRDSSSSSKSSNSSESAKNSSNRSARRIDASTTVWFPFWPRPPPFTFAGRRACLVLSGEPSASTCGPSSPSGCGLIKAALPKRAIGQMRMVAQVERVVEVILLVAPSAHRSARFQLLLGANSVADVVSIHSHTKWPFSIFMRCASAMMRRATLRLQRTNTTPLVDREMTGNFIEFPASASDFAAWLSPTMTMPASGIPSIESHALVISLEENRPLSGRLM
uniref:Uncharacterized protein n=1 Tax=Anopheles atroparvus TaxID=41427 RepID=A0A182JF74_ANOAO